MTLLPPIISTRHLVYLMVLHIDLLDNFINVIHLVKSTQWWVHSFIEWPGPRSANIQSAVRVECKKGIKQCNLPFRRFLLLVALQSIILFLKWSIELRFDVVVRRGESGHSSDANTCSFPLTKGLHNTNNEGRFARSTQTWLI